ncbi:MAG: hypothetical protein KDE25_09370 [Novosphingobium sp.]|nr:hypothetical protein [Novosphingobium sp.]
MPSLTILDPRAAPRIAVTPYTLSADASGPGLRVGLMSNMFFDASKLLSAVGEALVDVLDSPVVTLYEFPNASLIAPPEMIAEIAANNDVAVTAMGHCGSCTSSATRDAVNLARAGVPVCALITEKFTEAGGFVARSVGMPDVPRVQLPHPVAGTGEARIAEIARLVAPAIVASWQTRVARAA